MEKRNIITISGKSGSGKSSTAKLIANILGWKHLSSGDIMRKLAREKGLTLVELIEQAKIHPEIDHQIDETLASKRKETNIVIDSRLAFHWIPNSFKVFLAIDLETASKRIFSNLKRNALRRASEKEKSLEEVKMSLEEREKNDEERYQRLYHIRYDDPKNFDLIINTGDPRNNLKVVVEKIVSAYTGWRLNE